MQSSGQSPTKGPDWLAAPLSLSALNLNLNLNSISDLRSQISVPGPRVVQIIPI